MKIDQTKIEGLKVITLDRFNDERGSLTVIYDKKSLDQIGFLKNFNQNYYSISKKNVIRGMHFQIPPEDHAKFVYVTRGKILDVILDIRKNSPTYGQYATVELSSENHVAVFIPRGCAHGFLAKEDDSCVIYLQETMRSPENEAGIRFDSFELDWGLKEPIISSRDLSLPAFNSYNSPFV